MLIKQTNILIISEAKTTTHLKQKLEHICNLFIVRTPTEAIRLAHNANIHLIILNLYESEHHAIGLSFLFKESKLTKNIPILLLSKDSSMARLTSHFRYSGLYYSRTVNVGYIQHIITTYLAAKDFDKQFSRARFSTDYFIHMPIKDILKNKFDSKDCLFMLLALNTTKVASKELRNENFILEQCLLQLDYATAPFLSASKEVQIIKTHALQQLLVIPDCNIHISADIAIEIQTRFSKAINPTLCKFNHGALVIGASSLHTLSGNTDASIIDTTEKAVEIARLSSVNYYAIEL